MVAKDMIENLQPDIFPTFNHQITTARKLLLSVNETGTEYGPSTWWWRSRIWEGEIKFIKINRKYLLDRRDIEAFLARRKEKHGDH